MGFVGGQPLDRTTNIRGGQARLLKVDPRKPIDLNIEKTGFHCPKNRGWICR